MARGLRDLDDERARRSKRAASTRRSPSPSMPTASSRRRRRASTGKRVIDDKGKVGDANEAVIKALIEAEALIARGPLQARVSAFLALEEAGDLPQHAAMVHRHGQGDREGTRTDTLRHRALARHQRRRGLSRRRARTASAAWSRRPDWVISRQRAWGVPIAVFAISIRARTALTMSCRARTIAGRKRSTSASREAFAQGRRRRLVQPRRNRALPRRPRRRPGD